MIDAIKLSNYCNQIACQQTPPIKRYGERERVPYHMPHRIASNSGFWIIVGQELSPSKENQLKIFNLSVLFTWKKYYNVPTEKHKENGVVRLCRPISY